MIVQAVQWFCYATAAVTVLGFMLMAAAWIGAVNAEGDAHAALDSDDLAPVIPISRAARMHPSRYGR